MTQLVKLVNGVEVPFSDDDLAQMELDAEGAVEACWKQVRAERNAKLAASDWTQLPDVPGIDADAWADYRQELRDVTSQPDPFNITWPIEPGA